MTQYSKSDFMKFAIEEHLKCSEFPRVGAVIAKNGTVLQLNIVLKKRNSCGKSSC
jgi:pyrimidine deaminase RibD-like protein